MVGIVTGLGSLRLAVPERKSILKMRKVYTLVMIRVRGPRPSLNRILFFGVEGVKRVGVKMLCHDEGVEGAAIAIIEYEWGLRMRLEHF